VADEFDLLKDLGRESPDPDEASVQRARALLQRRIDASGGRRKRLWRPLHVRWAIAGAVSVLLASGFGFGLGTWNTQEGNAKTALQGLGFLPTPGWTVVQSETAASSSAVVSNVHVDAGELSKVPYASLRRLPRHGVVIVARLAPRGNERTDRQYPVRRLPLRVEDAAQVDLPRALARTSIVPVRIRRGVAGYNVDIRVFFGATPSPDTIAAVDRQLERLVVAADGVTLVVSPRIIRGLGEPMSIFGSVSSGNADEKVTIQFKACGVRPIQFRDAFETTTREGGGYTLSGPGAYRPPSPGVSGVFRAVSGDSVSADVSVQQRASIFLRPRDGGRTFQVLVGGKVSFWRKVVLLQRFERRLGVWRTIRRLRLTDSSGHGGAIATRQFRPAVPRGTLIRAVFPLSQARPCYLPGYSQTWRT
jgi:hypothetical protein